MKTLEEIPKFNTYRQFLESHSQEIHEALTERGYEVTSRDDYDTYKAWEVRGRQVNEGEKGTQIFSDSTVATPVFHYGAPVLDERGRQKFKSYKRNYRLFHIDQTKPITRGETQC
tara:strand:- start:110 stop:454 length:345 start_codon:yes stop_codon:yes gene_type:complete